MNNSVQLTSGNGPSISIEELEAQQDKERQIPIMKLEKELLIKRITDGGQSGIFLHKAYTSALFMRDFNLPLGKIINLDPEGFRLFHQILHIRHVSGWSEIEYFELYNKIESHLTD